MTLTDIWLGGDKEVGLGRVVKDYLICNVLVDQQSFIIIFQLQQHTLPD